LKMADISGIAHAYKENECAEYRDKYIDL